MTSESDEYVLAEDMDGDWYLINSTHVIVDFDGELDPQSVAGELINRMVGDSNVQRVPLTSEAADRLYMWAHHRLRGRVDGDTKALWQTRARKFIREQAENRKRHELPRDA